MIKKIDELIKLYDKEQINDKAGLRMIKNNPDESFILFKYNGVTIKAFVDKKEHEKFVIEHYNDKKVLKDIDIVTFLNTDEIIELLRGI